jgi:hypothetical protein
MVKSMSRAEIESYFARELAELRELKDAVRLEWERARDERRAVTNMIIEFGSADLMQRYMRLLECESAVAGSVLH